MKILILSNIGTGLYSFRFELINRLLEENEVIVSFPADNKYDNKFIKMGCKFIDINVRRRSINPSQDIVLFFNYFKHIKREKPEVVLTYTVKPNIYGGMVCRMCHIPYLVNITGLGSAAGAGGLLGKVVMALYKIGIKGAKCVFFQNEKNMKLFLKEGMLHNNYLLIPGSGVNLEHFLLQEYPHGETIEFVFISRIMKEKGIEQYLDAAKFIRKKYPYTRFHICGSYEEDYKYKLEEYQKHEIIIYHGLVEDMREILKKVHCTIHPSYYAEGMSNVLLESAASGRAIITTDKSGCRETIKNGITGYLVKEKDSMDLIEKIEKFLTLTWEEKRKMGLEGREHVKKNFDRNIVVNAYVNQIKLIKDRKRANECKKEN